jgi:hypothetical protein
MPPTLGQKLKHAREARGLAVADVTHVTRIPAQRILDLEGDRYTGSGSLTYAKSFLTTYSKFLDVDASSVLDHIQPPPLGGVRDYRYLVENLGQWVDDESNTPSMAGTPQSIVPAPRSIGIAALVCLVVTTFSVAGWYVLAGASANARTASSSKLNETGIPRAEVVTGPATAANTANGPIVMRAHAADGMGALLAVEEEEFTVFDVTITGEGDLTPKADPAKPIPKAIPVR